MTQESGGWKLYYIEAKEKALPLIAGWLSRLDDWVFKRPPSADRLAAATEREKQRSIVLTRELEAKRELEEARQHNRELEEQIKRLSDRDSRKKSTGRSARI